MCVLSGDKGHWRCNAGALRVTQGGACAGLSLCQVWQQLGSVMKNILGMSCWHQLEHGDCHRDGSAAAAAPAA